MGEFSIHKIITIWRQYRHALGAFLLLILIAIAISIPFSPFYTVLSASYTWTQTNWSGGATVNTPSHPGDQSGWNEFSAQDGNITATTSLSLLLAGSSTTHTTDTDFNLGATSSISIIGTGTASYLKLVVDKTVAPSVEWQRTTALDSQKDLYYKDIAIDSNDNIYVIGNHPDISIQKYDTDGNYTTFSSLGGFYSSLAIDPNTNDVLAISGDNLESVLLKKYNSSGTELCSTSTPFTTNIAVDSSGNIYTSSNSSAVTKRNSSCIPQWTVPGYGVSGSGGGIAVDSNGNIGITVVRNSTNYSWEKSYASTTGAERWSNQTEIDGTSSYILGYSMYVDADGSFYASGNADDTYGWIVKYNNSGSKLWHKTGVGTYQYSYPNSIAENSLGYIIYGGNRTNYHLFSLRARDPSNGDLIWSTETTVGVSSPTLAYGVVVDSEDNIYIAGKSQSIHGKDQGELVKFAPSYSPSGTWESPSVDTGTSSAFTTLEWSATTSANTSVEFQIASNSDNSTWNFIGPDGTASTYYATSGNAIHWSHSGDRYVKYKVFLETSVGSETPTLGDITINYGTYSSSGDITSSAYNTTDYTNLLADIEWSETLATSTNIHFQIRTATTSAGLASAQWYGPTGTTSYFTDPTGGEPLPSAISDGIDDQWMQYKAYLTGDGTHTPELEDITLSYVVNATPDVENVLNDPSGALDQNGDGSIDLIYEISDGDNTTAESYFFYDIGITLADEGGALSSVDTTNVVISGSSVFPSSGTLLIDNEILNYSNNSTSTATLSGIVRGEWPGTASWTTAAAEHTNGATVYLLASTTTGVGSHTVSATSTSFSGTLSPVTDISGTYLTDATIAVAVNDGELGNMIDVATSSSFVLDTINPTGGSLLHDSLNDQLTISVTDNSPTAMKLSNNNDLGADGVNADSGNWIAYGTDGNVDGYGDTPLAGSVNKSWTGTDDAIETVYVQFKDYKGNLSSVYSVDTPRVPGNVIYQDVSNLITEDFNLFVAWGVIPNPDPGFTHYKVYRSTGGAYSLFKTITDRLENYFIDTGLSTTTEYSYKVHTVDNDDNTSEYSLVVTDVPNGQGGSDLTPPSITNVQSENLLPQGATIIWTTDELADGTVGYSEDLGYGTEVGAPTMTTSHSVVLNGLTPDTTYNYRIRSSDPNANTSDWTSNYQFATPPGAQISNVTVTETTNVSATVAWITDVAADSYVVYSVNANMASSSEIGTASLATNHSVQLTVLSEGQTYYYYVKSTDSGDNTSINNNAGNYYSFVTTIDNTGPVISSVTVATVSDTSATLTWTTDENSTSQVMYGETVGYGASSTLDSTLSIQHSVTLSDLTKETQYYFKVSSTDAGSNNTEDDNGGVGYTFETTDNPGITQIIEADAPPVYTDTSAPNVASVSVTNIGSTTATVSW
ncbi:MAG: SBBP repeat-containing protein, partial [Candidatus Pacebacteria bacterium]|nr:SBBP repeat-containing protein [Candidatus Paceibacterota bacterium]